MFKKRGHGQSWSLDIILAFVVFVLVIGIFYTLLNDNKGDRTDDLTLESKTVVSNLDASNGQNNNLTIIDDGDIDNTELATLYDSDYETLKRELGIRGEFCIYIVDQYGNLITAELPNGSQVGSFGSNDYSVNGQPCGSSLS
ncbi:MAG TPA: hypothetical protein VEC16_04820 [Alphaproteobacteria bacterium]|nr:hypothetical protein [Alphaproteobacteria bacterium]